MNNSIAKWTGPQVWNSESFSSDKDWIVQLTERDIEEIHIAVNASIQTNTPIGDLTRENFEFNHFGETLLQLQNELLHGKGFTLLRGLPAGDAVSQNAEGHLLGHVIDQRAVQSGETRIYQTNRAQPFHSDSCDIVGLLCLRQAKQGGESSIASSAAIHNHLLNVHPESLKQLYQSFQCDRYGEIPEGKLPSYSVNVFNNIDEQLVCCGMDPDIRSAQRLDEVDELTQAQLAALDNFQVSARENCLRMSLQRGDIQLVNNLIAVHARESFVDHDDIDQRRYLIRLWLSAAKGRRLPDFLKERWGNILTG